MRIEYFSNNIKPIASAHTCGPCLCPNDKEIPVAQANNLRVAGAFRIGGTSVRLGIGEPVDRLRHVEFLLRRIALCEPNTVRPKNRTMAIFATPMTLLRLLLLGKDGMTNLMAYYPGRIGQGLYVCDISKDFWARICSTMSHFGHRVRRI